MGKFGELIQEADWKVEKHVPVIECTDIVSANQWFQVTVGLGKEIAHPNTTEHHISWISLFFLPDGEKFPFHIGQYKFQAHGSSVRGPNTSTIYTHHEVTTTIKTSKPGTIHAIALCNIHGLWGSTKSISLQ